MGHVTNVQYFSSLPQYFMQPFVPYTENWSIHNYVSKPSIPGVITDISDGARYKQKVALEDQCAEHIGLILNADGVPLFKSCRKFL